MDAMRLPDVATLSSQQKAHLLEHDCVWVMGIGVLWSPTDGALRSNNRPPVSTDISDAARAQNAKAT